MHLGDHLGIAALQFEEAVFEPGSIAFHAANQGIVVTGQHLAARPTQPGTPAYSPQR